MNAVERAIAAIAPRWAFNRARYRSMAAYYDAAEKTRHRKYFYDETSGNTVAMTAILPLRATARQYERNHDIFRGALNILVQRTVGPTGIGVEALPKDKAGDVHKAFRQQLHALWEDWIRTPEVTWEHDFASMQHLLARSWFRDGEVLGQILEGNVPLLDHGTRVPLSIEMIESDRLPLQYNDAGKGIVQGVQVNAWGRPRNYYLYKQHPGDIWPMSTLAGINLGDLKTLSADNAFHIKMPDRIRQVRGVSHFASVITRLQDIKDYEESERIAAKVAASMAAVIKKGVPDDYGTKTDGQGGGTARNLKFTPGMIFDDLLPGESIETIDTKRPNTGLEQFRQGQLRAAAAGLGVSYSALAKDYNGTYSAQRQELVESYDNYATLSANFIARCVRPIWRRFVAIAVSSGAIKVPRDLDLNSIASAMFITPQMPWIDPYKEAQGWALLEDRSYASAPEIIRRRGRNPQDVLDQEAQWQQDVKEKNITINRSGSGGQQSTAAAVSGSN